MPAPDTCPPGYKRVTTLTGTLPQSDLTGTAIEKSELTGVVDATTLTGTLPESSLEGVVSDNTTLQVVEDC